MALKHQYLCFKNSLVAQWKVNGHLVTVEVGVERGTSQWVKLNSLTLYKFRLESLNTQTVKCRRTVQHDRVSLHNILENVPDNGFATINNLLGTLDGLHDTALDELANDERLVEFGCHQLRQTALAHLQFGTNDDNRTC